MLNLEPSYSQKNSGLKLKIYGEPDIMLEIPMDTFLYKNSPKLVKCKSGSDYKQKNLVLQLINVGDNQFILKTKQSYSELFNKLSDWIEDNEDLDQEAYNRYIENRILMKSPIFMTAPVNIGISNVENEHQQQNPNLNFLRNKESKPSQSCSKNHSQQLKNEQSTEKKLTKEMSRNSESGKKSNQKSFDKKCTAEKRKLDLDYDIIETALDKTRLEELTEEINNFQ